MLRLARALSLALFAFLLLTIPTHAQDTFKLFTPTTGWYMTFSRIFYTSDSGAHWSDISPLKDHSTTPSNTLAVHFSDPRTAWALIVVDSGPQPDCDHNFDFDVASTTDAGAHWQRRTIPVPPADVCPRLLHRGSEIFFLDSAHGWVNLVTSNDTNSPITLLLYTTDAGSTWHRSDNNPCGPGPLFFNSPHDGWLLSHNMHQLCVTHNGGKTFTPEKLLAHYSPDAVAAYSLPTFRSNKINGFLPVTYATPIYGMHHFQGGLFVYETRDGGLTWQKGMQFGNFYMDDSIGTSVAGTSVFMTTTGEGKYCFRLFRINYGVGGFQFTRKLLNIPLSFVDESNGWTYLEDIGLLATHDAGQTWTNISPQASLFGLPPHSNWGQ